MTTYLVRAKPKRDLMVQLDNKLQSGKILQMKPFGKALQYGLHNAKIDPGEGYAYWIEEDYCSPPLAMERKAILDQYFDDIGVEKVEESQMGWEMINDKPSLWEQRR
jgi:hypothetical protein